MFATWTCVTDVDLRFWRRWKRTALRISLWDCLCARGRNLCVSTHNNTPRCCWSLNTLCAFVSYIHVIAGMGRVCYCLHGNHRSLTQRNDCFKSRTMFNDHSEVNGIFLVFIERSSIFLTENIYCQTWVIRIARDRRKRSYTSDFCTGWVA